MENPLLPATLKASSGSTNGTRSSCFVHALLEMQNHLVTPHRKSPEMVVDGKRKPVEHSFPPFITKSELSDMVLGVKELSKHLGMCRLYGQ
jgi:NAD+ kinase